MRRLEARLFLIRLRRSFVIRASSFLFRSNSGRAKLFERHLALDIGRRGDRTVNESRSATRKQDARNYAKLTDPHRAYGKISVFLHDEIDQSCELRRSIRARGNFENIRPMRLRCACFSAQRTRTWRRFEAMKRNDAPHVFFPRQFEKRTESRRRTQFDIDILGAGQEARKEIAALPEGQVICTVLLRMPRGDDERLV